MKISRKKALTLFALTLIIASIVFVNMNGNISAVDPEWMYLSGPSATPIHMHSNESLSPIHMNNVEDLVPVHMHFIDDPIIDPIITLINVYPNCASATVISKNLIGKKRISGNANYGLESL